MPKGHFLARPERNWTEPDIALRGVPRGGGRQWYVTEDALLTRSPGGPKGETQ